MQEKILIVVVMQAATACMGQFIFKDIPCVPWLLGLLAGVASMRVLADGRRP